MKNYFGDIEEDDIKVATKFVAIRNMDHIGKVYGNWTVIEKIDGDLFKMMCICGVEYQRGIATVYRFKSKCCSRCYRKSNKAFRRS